MVGCGFCALSIAFSSEVDTGSREENASKQEPGASVLIQSEPKLQVLKMVMRPAHTPSKCELELDRPDCAHAR
jgi:hypothetical protein